MFNNLDHAKSDVICLLDELTQSVLEYIEIFPETHKEAGDGERDEWINRIATLRARLATDQLKIAFLGEFSSGKSTLIYELLRSLQVNAGTIDSRGQHSLSVESLLPAQPTHTTAFPMSIGPAQGHDDDQFFVKFENQEKPEKITPVTPDKIRAYVSVESDNSSQREQRHHGKKVVWASLELADTNFPAILFDLPGTGSPGSELDAAQLRFLDEAECIVYVASRPLTDRDCILLSDIYTKLKDEQGQRRAFFVLSQIDKEWIPETGEGCLKWQITLKKNNEYLSKLFSTPDGAPDKDFIFDGFFPVSPHYEAEGHFFSETDPEKAKTLIQNSGMRELRNALMSYFQEFAGPRRVAATAVEGLDVAMQVRETIANRYEIEMTPLEKADKKLDALINRINVLSNGIKKLQDSLESLVKVAYDRSCNHGDVQKLRNHLQEKYKERIDDKQILLPSTVSKLGVDITNDVRAFLHSGEVAERWSYAWEDFRKLAKFETEKLFIELQRIEELEATKAYDESSGDLSFVESEGINGGRPGKDKAPHLEVTKASMEAFTDTLAIYRALATTSSAVVGTGSAVAAAVPTVGAIAAPIGTAAAAATAGGALAGMWSAVTAAATYAGIAAAAVTPLGWAAAAGIGVGAVVGKMALGEESNKRRLEIRNWIKQFSLEAVEARNLQVRGYLDAYKDELIGHVQSLEKRTVFAHEEIQRKIKDNEFGDKNKAERLRALLETCQEIHTRLLNHSYESPTALSE